MYIAKQRKLLILIGLFLLSGFFFAFPLLWPMGIAATVIFMSFGGIALGLAIGVSLFNLYQLCFPVPQKNNQKCDDLLQELENQREAVKDLGASLLNERMRFEELTKEGQKLDQELEAVQTGNVNYTSSEQGKDSVYKVTKPGVSSSQSLPAVFYGPPVLSSSDIEETQREIAEDLTVFKEAAAQLLQDQHQQIELLKLKNSKNNN